MRLLLLTCNAYRDAWSPFFALLRRHWPDCPYPIHLATDLQIVNHDPHLFSGFEVKVFSAGKVGWNRVLAAYLERYPDEPVLYMQEDYFLTSTPNQSLIDQALEWLQLSNAGCVRLYPCPGGDGEPVYGPYSPIAHNATYRISCQAAVWDPQYLHTIASMTRSPWQFEITGTKISRNINRPLYAFKREETPWPVEYICTAIVRGKWQQGALDYCASRGVMVDLSMRDVEAQKV